MSDMKRSNLIRNYKEDNLLAIIFQPVKAIAVDNRKNEAQKEDLLQEMIQIIQDAILL